MNRTIIVRPGLLVSLKTRLEGGVTYNRHDLAHETEGAGERTEWNTEKLVEDREEYAEATRVRGRVSTLIRGACQKTGFGLICLTEEESTLDARISEAEALCQEFNGRARHTEVRFSTLRGRIAENTTEAVRAVREEIHELMGELQNAMAAGEVAGIRDVAAQVTQRGRLLEEGQEARTALERAVKEARRVARALVKRVEEGAAATAEILAGANLALIATARHTFEEGELGDIADDGGPALPSAALGRFDGIGEEYQEPEPEPEAPAEPEPEGGEQPQEPGPASAEPPAEEYDADEI